MSTKLFIKSILSLPLDSGYTLARASIKRYRDPIRRAIRVPTGMPTSCASGALDNMPRSTHGGIIAAKYNLTSLLH